ncbi:MAG: hypothetical protein N2444_11350, partial [Methylocystis sp.]|nr:hypothetical protein [Methylocystis sp.]
GVLRQILDLAGRGNCHAPDNPYNPAMAPAQPDLAWRIAALRANRWFKDLPGDAQEALNVGREALWDDAQGHRSVLPIQMIFAISSKARRGPRG